MLVALDGAKPVGYLTLAWAADHPPFRRRGLPEIQDLDVLPSRRRRGVATRLLDAAEALAARRAPAVGLAVGLYQAYGPALRLYLSRGYLPDGGASSAGRPLLGGETVTVDDTLALHLSLELTPASERGRG